MDQAVELFWLDDAQWQAIAPIMQTHPKVPGKIGDRATLSGIIHVLRAGCAWHECPGDYGPHVSLLHRFKVMKRRGMLDLILERLAIEVAPAYRDPPPQEDAVVTRLPFAAKVAADIAAPESSPSPAPISARDIAKAQLEELALKLEGEPVEKWIEAMVAWHLDGLANARVEAWIPGVLGQPNPVVNEAVSRFHLYQAHVAIERLTAESHELRTKLLKAMTCIRFCARDPQSSHYASSVLKDIVSAVG